MGNFNRSEYMKALHSQAKEYREFYNNYYEEKGNKPDKDLRYSDFLKRKDNPITDIVKVYDVSYSANYIGTEGNKKNRFTIDNYTFKIYVIEENPETKAYLEENTKESFRDIKYRGSQELNLGLKDALMEDKNITIKGLDTPRGLERNEQTQINSNILQYIKQKGAYVEELDKPVNTRNQKGDSYNAFVSDVLFRK